MIPSELRICAELNGGGLSGEHIQLCAEGARRKPNLSGKRTEIQGQILLCGSSQLRLPFFIGDDRKEGYIYVR